MQPFYPIWQGGPPRFRPMWRLGIEGASAKAIGLERPDEYRYGKGSIELERVDTQREALALGVARQRAFWNDKGNRATSSLYIHGRDNKILKGNTGERTFPRWPDPPTPGIIKKAAKKK